MTGSSLPSLTCVTWCFQVFHVVDPCLELQETTHTPEYYNPVYDVVVDHGTVSRTCGDGSHMLNIH